MNERQIIEGGTESSGGGAEVSWINIVLGIWVLISPFVLGLAQLPRVMWNNVILGIVIGILAIIRTSAARQPGWSWVNVILGIWMIISPLVLRLANSAAIWNNVILGIIITILAWISANMGRRVMA